MSALVRPPATNMLILFAKYPVPGSVKTRMIPALGAERAARLHRRLTETALDTARASGEPVTVSFAGRSDKAFRSWLGQDVHLLEQVWGDLGVRMQAAFAEAFRLGADKVIAIGADVPQLTSARLHEALDALDHADVVIGPAEDGGYYLIGMRCLHVELFHGIDWGSDVVLTQTQRVLKASGLRSFNLPLLADMDRPEDLDTIREDPRFTDIFEPLLTVIIPTLEEESRIGETVAALQVPGVEVIVADGGSADQTCARAQEAGATVLTVEGGRAAQMNAAAERAAGQRLLFLHADTLLPECFVDQVHQVLDDPATVLGAFRFCTDSKRPGMRIIEWGTNVRSRYLFWPYGDQALFMEKCQWKKLGGFPDVPIMEDYILVQKARKQGRIVTVAASVVTSARRWQKIGVWRTLWRNQVMIAGYRLGISPERLSAYYRQEH